MNFYIDLCSYKISCLVSPLSYLTEKYHISSIVGMLCCVLVLSNKNNIVARGTKFSITVSICSNGKIVCVQIMFKGKIPYS